MNMHVHLIYEQNCNVQKMNGVGENAGIAPTVTRLQLHQNKINKSTHSATLTQQNPKFK